MSANPLEKQKTFPETVFPELNSATLDHKSDPRRPASFGAYRNENFSITDPNDRLRATVLSVHNAHRHGELYCDFLRARKRVFIDLKSWNLPEDNGMEFDQYDTPQSRSIVIHEYGQIVAGIRILPTKARCGCYSYMLRDAQLGLLDDIPEYILYEPAPIAGHIWEATRLFVSPEVEAKRRLKVQMRLITEMAKAAVEEGATHVIGIVPYVFKRWMARLGLGALPLGPKITIDGDTSQAAVMHVAAITGGGAGDYKMN